MSQKTTATAKRAAIWGGVLVLLGLSLWGLAKLGASSNGTADQAGTIEDPMSAEDWVKGNRMARAALIEYSDFQCPACGAYQPLVKQLVERYGGQMLFVYRHFPLSTIHANAEAAARAAEAAGKQGKFWEMHDKLFANQREWGESAAAPQLFLKYAGDLQLDVAKFTSDFNSPEAKAKVERDAASGVRAQVNATPTFYLNNQKISNLQSYDDLESAVKAALNPPS